MSPTEFEAVGVAPPRAMSISSSVSLEETPCDHVSKEGHQQIEAKQLQIEHNGRLTVRYVQTV